MAYFAQIDEDGTVRQVISVSNADAPDPAPEHSEPLGQAFIASLGLEGEWRQTSYHGSFRRRYAGIGHKYDAERDAFIEPQPYPSWTLDADTDWQPPTPRPSEGRWYWDELSLSWIELPTVT
jgi:hypothetical protein